MLGQKNTDIEHSLSKIILKKMLLLRLDSVRCQDNSCCSGASESHDTPANRPAVLIFRLSKILNSAQLLRSSVLAGKMQRHALSVSDQP